MTVRELKNHGISELKNFSPSAELDTSCLMQHKLNCTRTWLLLHANDNVSKEEEEWILQALDKRKTGLPIAYLTNHKEFFGYDFYVTQKVLIPKPDTEILVENAIKEIKEKSQCKICDMCTGSGCIGLSVFLALKNSGIEEKNLPFITFADISEDALEIAKYNAQKLAGDFLHHFSFVSTNLFSNINESFDFILTNPPYIPSKLVDELLTDGRNEPRLALDGDISPFGSDITEQDGLGIIRHLIPQIKNHLTPDGVFFLETGEYNAVKSAEIAEKCGFKNVRIIKDLEGQLRVTTGSC